MGDKEVILVREKTRYEFGLVPADADLSEAFRRDRLGMGLRPSSDSHCGVPLADTASYKRNIDNDKQLDDWRRR